MYKLRELERKDLVEINLWRNNPELIELLGAPFRFINLEVDVAWFDDYMKNRNKNLRCSIVSDDIEEKLLGVISLTSIDFLNQSAELHIMIGDKNNYGRGIGTFALMQMLRHAFFNMNLQRIELSVLAENKRAQNLYKKIGFVHEGTKRNARYKNGSFVDLYCYSILREEFVEYSKNNL